MFKLFGNKTKDQNIQGNSTGQVAQIEKLINQTVWTGNWSEADRKNLSGIIEAVEHYIWNYEPESYSDLLFVKGCAELELGLTAQASASFDRVLVVKPDHFGAQTLRNTPVAEYSMLRRPVWDRTITKLTTNIPAWAIRKDVLCSVRDGSRLVVSAFLGVERAMFPNFINTNLRGGVQVRLHDTPFGKVPTLYFFFDTHPTDYFLWEQCLHNASTFVGKDPFNLASGLIRQLMNQDYLYIVAFNKQNGEVIINRKHAINNMFRKQLSETATSMSGVSLQTDDAFFQGMNWISANFNMKQLKWDEKDQIISSVDAQTTIKTTGKEEQDKRMESLIFILNHPDRYDGPREIRQYGTEADPNKIQFISWELIETEPSRKHRIQAARELGNINSVKAGEALADCYANSSGDVKDAIEKSLGAVLKALVQQCPDFHLLPIEIYQQVDKASVFFRNGGVQFALSTAGEKAFSYIIARLSNGDSQEKIQCLAALGKLGTDEAIHVLLQNTSSAEHSIQTAAINALADCGSPLAAEPLQEMLRNERDRKSRRRLLRAVLATIRRDTETPAQLLMMIDAIVDADLEVRRTVIEFLLENEKTAQKLRTQIGDGEFAREKLISWLNDPDITTHYTAIRGLAILGTPDDIAAIESAPRYTNSATEIKKAISAIRARGTTFR
jgi:HEAT repeat protein